MRSEAEFVGRVFDLRVESDIVLPRLAAASGSESGVITVRRGTVPVEDTVNHQHPKAYFRGEPASLWMAIPDVARIHVHGGQEIVYDPEPGADLDTVVLFLMGSGLGALMIQRQMLVLHANGIEIGGKAVLCMGPSGIGKSTLAGAFAQAGYRLFADDVCPVDDEGMLQPGAATIKLWDTAAAHFQIDTAPLRQIQPSHQKFDYPVEQHLADAPLPVGLMVELAVHDSDSFHVERITGSRTYSILRANSYRFEYVAAMGQLARHFEACARVASRVPIIRVTRPASGMDLSGLMGVIVEAAHDLLPKQDEADLVTAKTKP